MRGAVHAVVLAGGSGERFWPASTPTRPKPFARLFGEQSLLQSTLARAVRVAAPDNVWLVGGAAYEAPLRLEARGRVPEANVLIEPMRRDTAPAVALAAAAISARAPDALMVVLPSDHYVPDTGAFAEAVDRAVVAARRGFLTCVGILPAGAETRYGYIVAAAEEVAPGVHAAARFVEKPPPEEAARLIAAGDAYWNAGLLVCRVADLRQALATHAPDIAAAFDHLDAADGAALRRAYPRLPAISLDYAVLQRARNVAVAPAAFRWHDVGKWAELPRVAADAEGCFAHGTVRLLDSGGCVVYNEAPYPVVVAGMRDVLVAHAADHVVLVTPLDTDGRALLRRLEQAGGVPAPAPFAALLGAARAPGAAGDGGAVPEAAERPWGYEVVWAEAPGLLARALCVRAGARWEWRCAAGWGGSVWCVRGSGVLFDGREDAGLRQGSRALLRPGVAYAFQADDDAVLLQACAPLATAGGA